MIYFTVSIGLNGKSDDISAIIHALSNLKLMCYKTPRDKSSTKNDFSRNRLLLVVALTGNMILNFCTTRDKDHDIKSSFFSVV